MKFKTSENNFKKIAAGTIALIGVCTLSFNGMTQLAKAAVVNKSDTVPTTYSSAASSIKEPVVPLGYVKSNYQIKIAESADQPTVKDIAAEEAAELGARDLWKLFNADLNGRTIEMSYRASTSLQPRAEWTGIIPIDNALSYMFIIDAVTGENRCTGQEKYWNENMNTGMDKALWKNPEKYTSLAKETVKKYQLLPGEIASAQYISQGYIGNPYGKNSTITIMVKSDNGQQVQMNFSRYNQELLSLEYDSWLTDAKILEEQADKDAQNNSEVHIITQQDIDNLKK